MSIKEFRNQLLPEIEKQILSACQAVDSTDHEELHEMISYHLGFADHQGKARYSGKKLRPMILLLCSQMVSGDWQAALPAAAAVELIHNFSLIHDDIQDQSPIRHGRETLWKKWGVPKAINAGDALFALAFSEIQKLQKTKSSRITLEASRLLAETCLALTSGQSLDLAFETCGEVSVDEYLKMSAGKTSALFSASAELGALIGNAEMPLRKKLAQFGRSLGLAFQMQDDWLGIWGEDAKTGKSNMSDLVSGKKSLPIIYATQVNPEIKNILLEGLQFTNLTAVTRLISDTGAKEFTQLQIQKLHVECLQLLGDVNNENNAASALKELVRELTLREF